MAKDEDRLLRKLTRRLTIAAVRPKPYAKRKSVVAYQAVPLSDQAKADARRSTSKNRGENL